MNENTLKTISEFNALPETPEKEEIKARYMSDEIGNFEFYLLAKSYLDKTAGKDRNE